MEEARFHRVISPVRETPHLTQFDTADSWLDCLGQTACQPRTSLSHRLLNRAIIPAQRFERPPFKLEVPIRNLVSTGISSVPESLQDFIHTHFPFHSEEKINAFQARDYQPPMNQSTNMVETEMDDGTVLRGIRVDGANQRELDPAEKKQIVFFMPNAMHVYDIQNTMRYIADLTGHDIVCLDYRGCGWSDGVVDGIQQKVDDGITITKALIAEGAKPENITICGFSIGGYVAPSVAAAFQEEGHEMNLVAMNTLSAISKAAPDLVKRRIPVVMQGMRQELLKNPNDTCTQILASIFITAVSIVDVAFRMTYLFFAILTDIVTCNFKELGTDLYDFVKTPIISTGFILTGIAGFISAPFTHAPLKWADYLFELSPPQRSTPVLLLDSCFMQHITSLLMHFSKWELDNYAAWEKVKGRKICFYAPKDVVISKTASLATEVIAHEGTDRVIQLPADATHITFPYLADGDSKSAFLNFFSQARAIV